MKKPLNRVATYLGGHIAALVVLSVVAMCLIFLLIGTRSSDGSITLNGNDAKYTQAQRDAMCDLSKKIDASVAALTGTEVAQDSGSGCAPRDIAQMGSSTYYSVDVSSPNAFFNAVNGRGFNEGYGLQCVAGFKQFMFALSGRYVATRTGGASGYASQQSQIEPLGFKWYSGTSGMKDGDWAIFGTGTYGHVAMYYQGKFFGQNQGAADGNVGNAFNLLGISSNGVIGYYRPNIYASQSSANTGGSTPPAQPSTSTAPVSDPSSYTVRRGDTLGGISLNMGWWPSTVGLYGDSGYAQRVADKNGIVNRGVIYPNQIILRAD